MTPPRLLTFPVISRTTRGETFLFASLQTVVKSPRCLVVSAYARCPDITKVLTPVLRGGRSLLLVRFSPSPLLHRLGGSALLCTFGQLGARCPDLDRPDLLRAGFEATQHLLLEGALTAGHDVSDGGLVVALLEMAFAGQVGLDVDLRLPGSPLELLFAEEPALVLEASDEAAAAAAVAAFQRAGLFAAVIGRSLSTAQRQVRIAVGGEAAVAADDLSDLFTAWEATSFALERRQCEEGCAAAEQRALREGRWPKVECEFSWRPRERPEVP